MAGIIGNPFLDKGDDDELRISIPIAPDEDEEETGGDEHDTTNGETTIGNDVNDGTVQTPHVSNPFTDDDTINDDVDSSNSDDELHVLSPDELFHDDEEKQVDSESDEDHVNDTDTDMGMEDDDEDVEPDDNELTIINPAGVPDDNDDVTGDSLNDSSDLDDEDIVNSNDTTNDDVESNDSTTDELKIVEPVVDVPTTDDEEDEGEEDEAPDSTPMNPITVNDDDSGLPVVTSNSDDEEQNNDDTVNPDDTVAPIVDDDHIVDHDDTGDDTDHTDVDGDHDGVIVDDVSNDDEVVEPDSSDNGHIDVDADKSDDNDDSDSMGVDDSTISVDDSLSVGNDSDVPVNEPMEDDVVDGSTDDGNDDDTVEVEEEDDSGDADDGVPVSNESDDSIDDDKVEQVVDVDGESDDDDNDSSGDDVLDGWGDSDSDDSDDEDGEDEDDDSFPVGEEDEFPLEDGGGVDDGDVVDHHDDSSGGDWVDEEPDEYALPDPGESYPDLSDGDPLLNDLLGDDVIEAIDHERGASPKGDGPHPTSDDGGHDDDDSGGGRRHEAILADEVGDGGALGYEATERYDSEIRPAAVERRKRAGRRVRSSGDLADGVRIGSAKAAERGSVRLRVHKAIDDPELARRLTIREWKQGKHVRFTKKDVRAMDYLTRWSFATTAQVARAGGWRDRKGDRLTRRFETWDDQGWAHANREFAGPVLWAPTDDGAELGWHKWLGGVSFRRMNPMSQSHSLGLSSLASWLLCGWDDAPDVMHLNDDWKTLMGELGRGESFIVSEREIRSCYSKIRSRMRGLLPAEYRCAMLGGVDPKTGETVNGRFKEFHDKIGSGEAGLESSPELVSCSLGSEGVEQWLWVVWGDWVWNVDPSTGDVSYVPVEDRYDVVQNKPMVDKSLGDRFVMLDHVPDLVVARRRRKDGSSRSLAVELELKMKDQLSYDRTMASYGSRLGKLLYDKVVWMVPDSTVALAVLRSAVKLGMTRGEDFEIIPFATSERRNSYWTGADMVPAVWGRDNRVIPMIDPDSVLLS